MTPAELAATKARMRTDDAGSQYGDEYDVPVLLAEIRRLQALIKAVEHTDNDFGTLFCPWCGRGPESNSKTDHATTCAAFNPDGSVK